MGRAEPALRAVLGAACLITLVGCDRGAAPQPAAPPAATNGQDRLTLIVPESANWSRMDALLLLADPKLGLSAAVQLIRLARAAPLCVPPELTDQTAAQLRVLPLADGLWALGVLDRRRPDVLRAPVLIGLGGCVYTVADGPEEEAAALHVSKDADVFPHLLITPVRTWIVGAPPALALTRVHPADVGFAWGEDGGRPYVGLVLGGPAGPREVARYFWEPYELGFVGPAADVLPDPPGGQFSVGIDASPLLIPVGGVLPEPLPIEQEPPPLRIHDPSAYDA